MLKRDDMVKGALHIYNPLASKIETHIRNREPRFTSPPGGYDR